MLKYIAAKICLKIEGHTEKNKYSNEKLLECSVIFIIFSHKMPFIKPINQNRISTLLHIKETLINFIPLARTVLAL